MRVSTEPSHCLKWPRLLVLLACTVLAGCSVTQQAQIPTPTPLPVAAAVERPTYTVQRGDILEELRLSGRVAAVKQEDLAFTANGKALRVRVRVGDEVRAKQLVAELDQAKLLDTLAGAKVTLDQAKLALDEGNRSQQLEVELAQLDLQEGRIKLNRAKSEAERSLAQIEVRRAEIRLERVEAVTNKAQQQSLGKAQLAYDRIARQVEAGRLYASIDGVVSGVSIRPGAQVRAFDPVMTILDPGARELRVENVTGQDLNRLSAKQPVNVIFNRYENQPVNGVVERLPQDNTSTQTEVQTDSAVHISYDAPNLDLEIGDLAAAVITLQQRPKVLYLPPAALRTFQGRRFVVVQDGERQRRVDVEVGIVSDDRVEITSGLKENQVVVGQ